MDIKSTKQYMNLTRDVAQDAFRKQVALAEDLDSARKRLIFEGIHNFMSVEQMAAELGLTPTRVRALMRKFGINPRLGRRTLADMASKALQSNAELLGIKPWQMDLTSPLAYLPAGGRLKQAVQEAGITRVTEEPEDPEFEGAEQLAERLTDAGLSLSDAIQWVNEVIATGEQIDR